MQTTIEQRQVSWEAAQSAAAAAVQEANAIGVRINVAVVDASGLRVAFLRMHGAPLHSIEISENKAFTAASFGLPTSSWAVEMKRLSEAGQRGLPMVQRFTMFGGGLPMRVDGVLVGGIGVSGASEDEDERCARAGLAAIGMTLQE